METVLILVGLFISCLMGWILIPRISFISDRKCLMDDPNDRDSHTVAIPRLGGFSFMPSILLSVSFICGIWHIYFKDQPTQFLNDSVLHEYLFLFCGLTLLYLIGLKDDLMGVSYRKKFQFQLLASLIFPLCGIYINNLYGLLGIYEIPMFLGIPLTILVGIFITNAINLIDGIDGLASGLSIVALTFLGILFLIEGHPIYSLIAFCTMGVLLSFFYFNVFGKTSNHTKIFMGDTGSLTLGYILAFLSIKYAQFSESAFTSGSLLIAFSALFIPVYDAIRVVIVRAKNGKPLFQPDRNHIHHKCLAAGMTHRQAMSLIVLCSVLLVLFNIFTTDFVNNNILFALDVALGFIFNYVLNYLIRRHQKKLALDAIAVQEEENEEQKSKAGVWLREKRAVSL